MNDTDHDLLTRIDERTAALAQEFETLNEKLEGQYVLKSEFEPVRKLVYGVVWVVVVTVLLGLLGIIIHKGML